MKALSIWQPWAELIAAGIKDVENRPWATSHRGPLVVQAGLKWDQGMVEGELLGRLEEGHIEEGDAPDISAMKEACGYAVCVVDLVDCVRAEDSDSPWAGSEGYCFVLANPRRVHVRVKGRQKLYTPSDEESEAIERELGMTSKEARGSYSITWEQLVGVASRLKTNEEVKTSERQKRGGQPIDVVTKGDLEGAKITAYKHRPHGSLPMEERWAASAIAGGSKLYDSARIGDDGLFDDEEDAKAHGEAWRRAQRERRGELAGVKASRLIGLPIRLDEIDEAIKALQAHRKKLGGFLKECADDHKTLRDEQRAPEVGIRWKDGAFEVAEAPSLSEGSIGRRWWGSDRRDHIGSRDDDRKGPSM